MLTAVEAGSDTRLNHASTLDLWIFRWGAERLGYELDFDRDATATIRIPADAQR